LTAGWDRFALPAHSQAEELAQLSFSGPDAIRGDG
jgi:hypothetical protein